jgi:hypothetical protein
MNVPWNVDTVLWEIRNHHKLSTPVLAACMYLCGLGISVGIAGQSGDQIPGPGAHPASCTMVPGLSGGGGGKAARAWWWPPPPCLTRGWEWVERYLYCPSRPLVACYRVTFTNIYGAPCKPRKFVLCVCVYGVTFGNAGSSLFLLATQCFNTESMQKVILCHSCV